MRNELFYTSMISYGEIADDFSTVKVVSGMWLFVVIKCTVERKQKHETIVSINSLQNCYGAYWLCQWCKYLSCQSCVLTARDLQYFFKTEIEVTIFKSLEKAKSMKWKTKTAGHHAKVFPRLFLQMKIMSMSTWSGERKKQKFWKNETKCVLKRKKSMHETCMLVLQNSKHLHVALFQFLHLFILFEVLQSHKVLLYSPAW